jgi:DNA-binding LacI/PurR family transcriptional regulator
MTKKNKVATLKDISKKAGLSVTTISDILNKNPKCFAGEKTKEKVFKIADEIGYHPNLLSRSMRAKRTYTIALIFPNLHTNVTLANIELIEKLAWEKNFHVFIGYSQNNIKKEEELLKDFVSRRVDGIILIVGGEGENRSELGYLIEHNYPFVTIGKFRNYKASFVTTDYYLGGQLAAEYFYKLGFKKVAVFSFLPWGKKGSEPLGDETRRSGFNDKALEYGMSVEGCNLFVKRGMETLPIQMEELVTKSFTEAEKVLKQKNRPEAIFARNDDIALGIIKAALKLGLKIPEDLSVIGFDDSPSSFFSPVPITTVRQEREQISRRAFEILIKKMDTSSKDIIGEVIPPKLIIRSSTIREKPR